MTTLLLLLLACGDPASERAPEAPAAPAAPEAAGWSLPPLDLSVPSPPSVPDPAIPAVAGARERIGAARAGNDPGKFDEAEQLLSAYLETHPESVNALVAMGDLEVERVHLEMDQRGRVMGPFAPKASGWYLKALAVDPRARDALRGLATLAEFSEDTELAVEIDRRRLTLDPGDVDAMVHLGRILQESRQLDEAEETLTQARERWREREASGYKGPDHQLHQLLVIHEQLGKVYMQQGRAAESEAILLEAVKLIEDDPTARQSAPSEIVACPYVALGQLYRTEGRDGASAEMLKRAADLEPQKPTLQLDAAFKLFYAGEYAEAERYVDRALAAHPDPIAQELKGQIRRAAESGEGVLSAEALTDAAVRAFDRYDFAGARTYLEQAREQRTDPEQDLVYAYALLLERRYDEAEALTKGVGGDLVDAADAVRGHLALVEKDYDAAESLLRPALERTEAEIARGRSSSPPHEPDGSLRVFMQMALLGDAWRLANQAQHAPAIARFDQVLDIKPSDIYALLGKANSVNALGRFDEAAALLERVLAIDPENQYALAELALVRYNQGDDGAAEARFKEAIEVEPTTYTCPYEGLGLVYLRQGKTDEAAAAFEQAIEINPEIEYKKFNGLAQIYIDQGRYDEARALLKQSIENYPYDDEAARMLAALEETP